jgi:hypothetical protein
MPGKRARPVCAVRLRGKGPAQQTPRRAADPSQFAKNETAWTTTKSAATTPGTGTSPCPCSPPRSSPSPPTPNNSTTKRGHHQHRRAADPAVLQRNPATLGHPDPPKPPTPPHQPLVTLATNPPDTRETRPLPATTPQTSQGAAAVLGTARVQRAGAGQNHLVQVATPGCGALCEAEASGG